MNLDPILHTSATSIISKVPRCSQRKPAARQSLVLCASPRGRGLWYFCRRQTYPQLQMFEQTVSRSNNEKSPPRSRQHQPKKATEVEQKLLLSGSTLQLWLHWTKPQGARRTTPRLLHGPKKVATRCKEKSSFTLRLLTMLPGFKSCKNGADS